MEKFIGMVAVILILAYIILAIWFICKRQTVRGSVGASIVFLCGGLVIIPVAESVASYACLAIAITILLAIIATLFGG